MEKVLNGENFSFQGKLLYLSNLFVTLYSCFSKTSYSHVSFGSF